MCGLDLEKMGVGYKDSLLGIALGSAPLYFTRQYCVNDVEDNTAHSSMSELETRNSFSFLFFFPKEFDVLIKIFPQKGNRK